MYNIPYFKADDQRDVVEFMHQHPFIVLCGCDIDNKPVATQVPVLFEERNDKMFLVGHVMKQTDHQKAFAANNNVLAIFTGPHTYVSASWYTDPKQASTWNYVTVHVKGTLKFIDEDNFLLRLLIRLTAQFEGNINSPSLVEKLPEAYMQRLMKAIIAFEIEVKDIEHVFKLSQNQDAKSYQNIINQLMNGDADAQEVAEIMLKRKS